jgi:hypothetical protein
VGQEDVGSAGNPETDRRQLRGLREGPRPPRGPAICEKDARLQAVKDQVKQPCDTILFKTERLENQFSQIKAALVEFRHETQLRLHEVNCQFQRILSR